MQDRQKLRIETKEFMPEYGHKGDAGFDIKAYCPAGDIRLEIGETVIVPSGLKMDIPEGYEVQLRSRSGLTSKYGIVCAQGLATIDEPFVGELGLILRNEGDRPFYVTHGMRVVQGVLTPVTEALLEKVDSITKSTARGGGAYGSTGLN